MTTVSRTFVVTAPPEGVIDYLQDFSRAEQWDPGTQSCVRLDNGPIRVGSQWRNRSKIAGVSTELIYELSRLTDRQIVLIGENDRARSFDTITVIPHDSGSEVTYEAVIEMRGAAKVTAPLVKLIFEKIGSDTEKRLTDVLNGLSR